MKPICSAVVATMAITLAACGGGGGGGGGGDDISTPTPARLDAHAGYYIAPSLPWAQRDAHMVIHPNGRVVLDLTNTATGNRSWFTSSEMAWYFDMLDARSGELVYAPLNGPVQRGSGGLGVKAVMLQGQTVHNATINRITVPVAAAQLIGFYKQAPVYPGMAQAKLAGSFTSFAAETPGSVSVDAAGSVFSGPYAPDCNVNGEIYHYDAASNTLAISARFTGTGCQAIGVRDTAAIEMLGAVAASCPPEGPCPSGLGIKAWGGGAFFNVMRTASPTP